jgi:hypothetical protein
VARLRQARLVLLRERRGSLYHEPALVLLGNKRAWGTGKIWTQKAGCSPSYKCRFSSRWVGISLTTIKKHGAQPYYDRMAVEMRVGSKMHWFVGWFKYYPGAKVPSWIFPLVWPYL